jgi:hypothetical protein
MTTPARYDLMPDPDLYAHGEWLVDSMTKGTRYLTRTGTTIRVSEWAHAFSTDLQWLVGLDLEEGQGLTIRQIWYIAEDYFANGKVDFWFNIVYGGPVVDPYMSEVFHDFS